jgi:hypothetical protein
MFTLKEEKEYWSIVAFNEDKYGYVMQSSSDMVSDGIFNWTALEDNDIDLRLPLGMYKIHFDVIWGEEDEIEEIKILETEILYQG